MQPNIGELLKQITEQIKKEIMGVIPEAKKETTAYLKRLEKRTAALFQVLAETNDAAFLVRRLKEEPDILKAELLTHKTIGKGAVQKLSGNIITIFLNVITALLPLKSENEPGT